MLAGPLGFWIVAQEHWIILTGTYGVCLPLASRNEAQHPQGLVKDHIGSIPGRFEPLAARGLEIQIPSETGCSHAPVDSL